MATDRSWTVLFIGGASGTGKSSLAYEIARFYGVNVVEADDIHLSVKEVTTKDAYPAIHYWDSGINWMDIGVARNVSWLIDVSKEMAPVLKKLADRHIEDKLPVIIEGDFIYPEMTVSHGNPEIKSIFVRESDRDQIIQNFLAREGGELQSYRADISIAYGEWISKICGELEIGVVESTPWDSCLNRAISKINNWVSP